MNFESNFKKIIPYCSENFITIPLWEEGNYCWQMNVWKLFKNNSEMSFDDYLNELQDNLDQIFEEVEKEYPKFFIEYYITHQQLVDSHVIFEFSITQSNIGDVLESDFEYNYNIEEYMAVAIALLEKLEN